MIVVHSEEDRVGIVWDGTGISFSDDIDFQTDDESISMVFTGFESSRFGLASHAWAIGTAPLYDDVMSFTNNGMSITDEQGDIMVPYYFELCSNRFLFDHFDIRIQFARILFIIITGQLYIN